MKKILFAMALCLPFPAYSGDSYSIVLKNESMLIILDMQCSPCDIECNNIHYRLFDIKKGAQISGKAESINAGVNRNFIGYRLLLSGKRSYRLNANTAGNAWNIYTEHNFNTLSEGKIDTLYGDGTC